jgi:hypothetical protein
MGYTGNPRINTSQAKPSQVYLPSSLTKEHIYLVKDRQQHAGWAGRSAKDATTRNTLFHQAHKAKNDQA